MFEIEVGDNVKIIKDKVGADGELIGLIGFVKEIHYEFDELPIEVQFEDESLLFDEDEIELI